MNKKQIACWDVFAQFIDLHVDKWAASDPEHAVSFIGDCPKCEPGLAALRYLGWLCEAKLAAKLDAINALAVGRKAVES